MSSQTTETESDSVNCLSTEGMELAIEEIINATSNNDLELLEQLLANKTPEFRGQALYFVVKKGIIDDLNKTTDTANLEDAAKAIKEENKKLVKLFLNLGVDFNVAITDICFYRCTLFGYVCRCSDVDIVSMMMEHGADWAFEVPNGLAPIKLAFQSGNAEKINFFLKLVNAENTNNWNLLHYYICYEENPQEYVIARLLQIGADINKLDEQGYTVLSYATMERNTQCVKFLISQGADVNGINNNSDPGEFERENETELTCAAMRGNIEIVKILLESGADPNLGDPTPLIVAASRDGEDGSLEIADLLLKYGADINKSSELYESTPLAAAALASRVEIVELLLDRGALKDNNALIEAAIYSHTEVVELLLNQGFSPNIRFSGSSETLLLHAVLNEYVEGTKLLLDHGARVNEVISSGKWKYALHCAVHFGYKEIVELLVDYGADINLDDNGQTAVTIAIVRGPEDLRKYMVKRMILMKAQGFNVSEVNLNAAKAKKGLANFQNRCDREIGLLMSRAFDDSNLSYHDILTIKDVCKLASLASNENIVRVIKSERFVDEFPNYGPMIVEHFEKGILENRDFQLVTRFINYLATRNHDQLPKLSFIAISEIFNYLNTEDVAKLREL